MKSDMLNFVLKKKWYDKISYGIKTVEYREVKDYWKVRLENQGCFPKDGKPWDYYSLPKDSIRFIMGAPWCVFRRGYTEKKLYARVIRVEVMDGKNTDLQIDKPVFAIHFENLSPYPLAW